MTRLKSPFFPANSFCLKPPFPDPGSSMESVALETEATFSVVSFFFFFMACCLFCPFEALALANSGGRLIHVSLFVYYSPRPFVLVLPSLEGYDLSLWFFFCPFSSPFFLNL